MVTERVDDIPLIASILDRVSLSNLIDEHFSAHGNWSGVSLGKVAVTFIIYVLSRGDHRISHVETWAEERLHILRFVLREPNFNSKDVNDTRLGLVLERLSHSERWKLFEQSLNRSVIRVYDLNMREPIRLDATIAQSFQAPGGLIQYGFSKQHRSDLPQLKVMLATLDPLAMPLFSIIAPGNKADDGLYGPIESQVMECLATLGVVRGLLFVGDCKMGSVGNRFFISQNGHYYLCPLGKTQCSTKEIMAYLEQKGNGTLNHVYKNEEKVLRAKVFEVEQEVLNPETGAIMKERRLIVYSVDYAKSQHFSFESKLDKAQKELEDMFARKQGKATPETMDEVRLKVSEIIRKQEVASFFSVQIEEEKSVKQVRKYGDREAGIVETSQFHLNITRLNEAVSQHEQTLGWRVYATNAPFEELDGVQAVEHYRNEYKIEHVFNDLMNKMTALSPIFLQKQTRIKALIQLLLVALKFSCLIQHEARTNLKNTGQSINELYPGNPKRATREPTTNLMLSAMKNITLVIYFVNNQSFAKVTNLKPIHEKILKLLNLNLDVYLNLEQILLSSGNLTET